MDQGRYDKEEDGRPPEVAIKMEDDTDPPPPAESHSLHGEQGSNELPDLATDSFDTNVGDTFESYDSDSRNGPDQSLLRGDHHIRRPTREAVGRSGMALARPSADIDQNTSRKIGDDDAKEGNPDSKPGVAIQCLNTTTSATYNNFSFDDSLAGLHIDEAERGDAWQLPDPRFPIPMDGMAGDAPQWSHYEWGGGPWGNYPRPNHFSNPVPHAGGPHMFQDHTHGFHQYGATAHAAAAATGTTSFHQQQPPIMDNSEWSSGQHDSKLPPQHQGQQHLDSDRRPFLPEIVDGPNVASLPRASPSSTPTKSTNKRPKRNATRAVGKNTTLAKREQKPRAAKKPPPPQQIDSSSSVDSDHSPSLPQPYRQQAPTTDRAKKAMITWHQRLKELYAYKKEHGDTNVPQKYPKNRKLGIWVNKQRMEYKFRMEGNPSSMTDFKIKALEKAGFHWAKRKGEAAWEGKYEQLKAYKEKYGHCNVPTKCDRDTALGRWVSTQRSKYKKGNLPEDCVDKLNEIGFTWCMVPTSEQHRTIHTPDDDDRGETDEHAEDNSNGSGSGEFGDESNHESV